VVLTFCPSAGSLPRTVTAGLNMNLDQANKLHWVRDKNFGEFPSYYARNP